MVEITYRCGNCNKTKVVEYRDDAIATHLHQSEPRFYYEGLKFTDISIISNLSAKLGDKVRNPRRFWRIILT